MGRYNAKDDTYNVGEKVPASQYAPFANALRDPFSDQTKNIVRKNNTHGHSYYPDHRHKGGTGVFAIPEVGARVLVMFEGGKLSSPVVVGKINTSDEFQSIHSTPEGVMPGVPKGYQNVMPSQKMQKGLNSAAYPLWDDLNKKFLGLSYGGWPSKQHMKDSPNSDHNTGDAIDVEVGNNAAQGAAIYQELKYDADKYNIKYLIHDNKIWSPDKGERPYEGKSPHDKHIHVSFNK
jgi:hypothetical protein